MENKDQPAFPARVMSFMGNQEMEVGTPGLSKREYITVMMAQAMLSEYVKRPGNPLMESIVSQSIKMADELLKQIEDGKH